MQIEDKNNEITDIRSKINNYMDTNSHLIEDKHSLEKKVHELREIKAINKNTIEKMIEDNERLSRACNEQEEAIHRLEIEKEKLLALNEELNYENKNNFTKIKSKDEMLSYNQRQLNECNKTISKLTNNINELEAQNSKLFSEIKNVNDSTQNEIKKRIECEKLYDELERNNRETEMKLSKYLSELATLRNQKEKLFEDNTKMYNEIDILKNHIFVINEQNTKVITCLLYL